MCTTLTTVGNPPAHRLDEAGQLAGERSRAHSELVRDVTEQPFSRAWTTILAERHVAPNGGSVCVLPDLVRHSVSRRGSR